MIVHQSSLVLALSALAMASGSANISLRGVADTDDTCHGSYTTAEDCDADDQCAWCECSAIPSACYSLDVTANLPPGVFQCHKQNSGIDESQALTLFSQMMEARNEALNDAPDWDKIKSLACLLKQTDKETCLEDASFHCSWCHLASPPPDGGAENVCFPGFASQNAIDQGLVDKCSTKEEEGLESEVNGQWDFLKCWEQQEHDGCVSTKETACSWCELTQPVAGVSSVCQPASFADSMVQSGIAKSCTAKAEEREELPVRSFTSEKTNQSFSFGGGLDFALEDETVDPSFCDPKSPKSLAGYVSLDGSKYDGPGEDKHYFYWFFESRSKADENTPLFIWLTGGPGCSSSLALLSENGPCSVNEEGNGTVPNPSSWNSNAHALWLDQPTGVGFSYGKSDDHNEDMVGENAYYFLQSFLKSHPEYAKNPLFITGESYAGHYVPAITHRIWRGNKEKKEGTMHLNLQGMAIGNGLTNPEVQYPQYAEMAFHNSHSIQVIDAKSYTQMKKETAACTTLINKCNSYDSDHAGAMETFFCQSAVAVCNMAFMMPYQMTGLNPYDIREVCEHPPLCYDFSKVDSFLNSETTKKALHITKDSSKWASCNFGVHSHFMNDWMKDMTPYVKDVLNDGIRVLVYAGDVDFICNYLGNRAWTLALDWDHKEDFNKAKDHEWSDKAGLAKTSNGFTFLQVYDAGHMVPMNQPEVALTMIDQFFAGTDF